MNKTNLLYTSDALGFNDSSLTKHVLYDLAKNKDFSIYEFFNKNNKNGSLVNLAELKQSDRIVTDSDIYAVNQNINKYLEVFFGKESYFCWFKKIEDILPDLKEDEVYYEVDFTDMVHHIIGEKDDLLLIAFRYPISMYEYEKRIK